MSDNRRKSISLDELIALDEEKGVNITFTEEEKKKYSKKELKEAKRDNKYYLPVLSINDATMWPSKPKKQRRHFTDEVATETCLSNCCDVPGLWSACCRMDPDDLEHVLGPISEKWIKKIIRHFNKKGYSWTREDVVIDFEEGKLIGQKFFNGHPIFDKKTTYPILRFQAIGPRFGCKFLNPNNGKCGIYKNRPPMCQDYYCEYVKSNFLVRTKDKPNTYQKIDVRKEEDNEF